MEKTTHASKLEDWDYRDESHSANERLRGDGEWSGPVLYRRCTNWVCLIAFLLANAAMGAGIYFLYQDSDTDRLVHGNDFRGQVCGVGGLSNMPYTYFPDTTNLGLTLCIERCPQYFVRDYVCYYDTDYQTLLMEYGCWDSLESTRLGFYCIPGDRTDRANVYRHLMQPLEVLKRATGDYILAWDVVLGGVAVSALLGVVYIVALQWRLAAIWLMRLTLLAALALVLFFAYLIYLTSQYADDQDCGADGPVVSYYCDSTQKLAIEIVSFVVAGVTGVLLVVLILRWKALCAGTLLMRAAGKPLRTMKQLMVLLLMQLVVGLAFLAILSGVMALTMSAGQVETVTNSEVPGGKVNTIVFKTEERAYVLYNFGMTLWWLAFLSALGETVMSIAVSSWYFSRGKSGPSSPLCLGFRLCFRFHLGTLCWGSFLHTVVWAPAAVLGAVSSAVRNVINKKSGLPNCAATSCCCLEGYERGLKFVDKRAYIYMGLFGSRYLVSAKKAYFLVFRNKARLGVALLGGELMSFFIKLVLVLSGSSFSLWYFLSEATTLRGMSVKDLSSITGPTVLTVIACWYVAQVFGGALGVCVNTTLLCVASDEEMFAKSQRFALDELQAILDPLSVEKTEEQRDLMPLGLTEAPGESKKKHFLGALDDGGVDAVINTYAYDHPDVKKNQQYKGLSPFDDDIVSTSRSVYQPNLFYSQEPRLASPDQDPAEDSRPSFSPATSLMSRSSHNRPRVTGARNPAAEEPVTDIRPTFSPATSSMSRSSRNRPYSYRPLAAVRAESNSLMSKFALLAGVGLMLAAATGKVVMQAVRVIKLRKAGMGAAGEVLFKGPFEKEMTRREAALILGVREHAPETQVVTAYKRLMMINHPDTGGSTFVASKINEAKNKMLAK